MLPEAKCCLKKGSDPWKLECAMVTKADIEQLTAEEKIFLVEEIWDSLAAGKPEVSLTDAQKKLVEDRWAEFKRNPERAVTLEEFKKRMAEGQ